MKYYPNFKSLPIDAVYLGSTEGPDRMSEETADLIDDSIMPAYIVEDGRHHYFDLCPN
jgi:hypothetical protein